MDILERISQAVIEGDAITTPVLAEEALQNGLRVKEILMAFTQAMERVGEEWRAGNMFIPEVLISSRAVQSAMNVVRPHLTAAETKMKGKIIIGTVQGDMHDIGKCLVAMMIEGAGYQVIDLGVGISATQFVKAVKVHQPDILAMSSLLTTTIPYMRDTILTLKEAGLRDEVKVLVGGAPVTQQFADSIGADGYAPDGATAMIKTRQLLGLI